MKGVNSMIFSEEQMREIVDFYLQNKCTNIMYDWDIDNVTSFKVIVGDPTEPNRFEAVINGPSDEDAV